MRVLIAYTARHIDTINSAPENAEWRYVGDDPLDYWRTMCEFWIPTTDLLVVEHDVVCRPDILESVESCPEPWVAYKYDDMCCPGCSEAWSNTLGCTRFRKELIAAVPGAVTNIEDPMRHWSILCNGIGENLRREGYSHHWHGPAVRHHHMSLAHLSGV